MNTSVLHTRADYMANRCTHREYYAQFVTESTKEIVRRHIGESLIRASKDPHFNDIPLERWDRIAAGGMPRAVSFKDVGDMPSLCGENCIAKEAAQQIRES